MPCSRLSNTTKPLDYSYHALPANTSCEFQISRWKSKVKWRTPTTLIQVWRCYRYSLIIHLFDLSSENGEHGDVGEEIPSTGEYIEIEEPLNGLLAGDQMRDEAKGHGAGRLASLAESDLLQASDGEREEEDGRGMEGELDIMEVLEDQPFEVLDSAACGDMSQEPSHLGMLVCVRVCVTVYGMCDAVISFFLLIKQASLTCVCTYTNQCFHLSTFHSSLSLLSTSCRAGQQY